MTAPEDAGTVLTAIKLGWCIAEVRGRNRPDAPPGAKAGLPGPPSHALPLRVEQTSAEQRIEAQAVLRAMARKLSVDRAEGQPSYSRAIDNQARMLAEARKGAAAAGGGTASEGGTASGAGMASGEGTASGGGTASEGGTAPGGGTASEGDTAPGESTAPGEAAPGGSGALATDPGAQWDALQELLFKFDQHIQDTLAARADMVASGYQLGRALAEPYWALDTALGETVKSPAAWWFLLGAERCREMGRLVGRLSVYFHPYTAAAIAGSVQVWRHVADDQTWREKAYDALYQQIRRWYELVVMGQDPTTLVQPYALIRNFRVVRRALRIFWPELSGAVIAAAALSGFAVVLGQHNINSFLKSALGFIAIAGFSLSGLTAKLKNQAQAMIKRLRQDVYTDLVAIAITTAPKVPSVPDTPAKQNAQMVRMVRERSITPVTSN